MVEEVKKKSKFDRRDWAQIADYIVGEYERRKNSEERCDLEKRWKDIDRQLRMEPDLSHKNDSRGRPDPKKRWMPEMELPLQSQTLEVLTADSRRMKFPDAGLWFGAHAALTDDYLEKADFQSYVAGDENEVPSQITQENANKLVEGTMAHWMNQYDFAGNYDLIDSEAFKYGVGVGRVRLVTKNVFMNTNRGMISQKQRIPVLFPRSIKNTYLDDREHVLMNEGHLIAPAQIAYSKQSVDDLKLAANKGSSDPEKENGGWMPKNVKDLEGNKEKEVEILEYEGDLIIPRKTAGSMYIPRAIVTVVIGKDGDKQDKRVARFRFKDDGFSSYIIHPYQLEGVETPYSTSPLIKGWSIQKAAVDALTRLMEASALNTQPPIKYDSDDAFFSANGGPNVFPGANWPTTGDVEAVQIGNPAALFQVYVGFLQQYADVTGINAPRLGAQTVSHTTAFAKEAELSRGTIRTVDYVRASLKGPMTQALQVMYSMGRKVMNEDTIYIQPYDGFVKVDKDRLPEEVVFEAHGSGGPAEESQKQQNRLAALQLVLQVDQMAASVKAQGLPSSLNFDSIKEHILRQGGWTDVDAVLGGASTAAGPEGGPEMAGGGGAGGGALPAVVQALALQGQQ